jgi:membrane protein
MADRNRDGGTATLPGAGARTPSDIPAPGWKEVALRVKDEIKADRMILLAAGVAFYALLGIFPALLAAITIWGLFADPQQIQDTVAGMADVVPEEAMQLIEEQMTSIAATSSGALGFAAIVSVLGALWAASSGVKGLMNAVGAAYNEPEERGFLKERGTALGLTLGAILLGLTSVALIAIVPAAINLLGFEGTLATVVLWARWPVLLVFVAVGLSVLYRLAPDREDPRWQWVSWGAGIATAIWLLASVGFSVYVQNFGNYDETYGTLGSVIVLMMWLFVSAIAILLGAEINSELERQSVRDTTTGQPLPRGSRGAYAADSVPGDGRAPAPGASPGTPPDPARAGTRRGSSGQHAPARTPSKPTPRTAATATNLVTAEPGRSVPTTLEPSAGAEREDLRRGVAIAVSIATLAAAWRFLGRAD